MSIHEQAAEPRRFREVQRLAYACAEQVAARLRPGLWAVEPRPGFRGTGAESEEILVVTGSRDPVESAFRLDDDLPRVRRWAEAA